MENPGFAPAHAELGELALAARDPAAALLEYGQAVEVSPDDVVLRLGHGRALLAAGHAAEAAVELRRAIALDPEWAEPYVVLGNALQKGGDAAGARTAWAEFLSRAPRNEPRRAWAEQQVAMP
jgi:predicted Zn-dependent protease